jgi:hypothetical protein
VVVLPVLQQLIFINTTSPRQSNAKHRNQVKKVKGKETSHGQVDKSSGSVRNYLSCIKTWTVLLKFYVEEFYSPTLKMTLSGVEILNTLEW